MKLLSSLLLGLICPITLSAQGLCNHPDSVWIKGVSNSPKSPIHIEYSVDGRTWVSVGDGWGVVSSDFGQWGSQKKMYSPVLKYDGRKIHAEWYVGKDIPQIAVTETENLYLWKPQEYPTLSSTDFEAKKAQLQSESGKPVRIPYYIIDELEKKIGDARFRKNQESESMRADAQQFKNIDSLHYSLTINTTDRKPISPMLYGIFFEDINYAADGGLYAELIQNRDFEYSKKDNKSWNSKTSWKLDGHDTEWTIETEDPIHANNPHYARLVVSKPGAKLVNTGYDGIPVKDHSKYNLTIFLRGQGQVKVSLVGHSGKTLATSLLNATSTWSQNKTVLTTKDGDHNAHLVIEPQKAGSIDIDFVSLFPQDTYKGRVNGLRRDLAEHLEALHPKFVRFPGGCLSHGEGIDNMYHWQATIGELWERQSDFNIWNYHQTRGLGFYEYFQFCEDLGAEPLPVLPAGVPCQNSARGGYGQQGGLPFGDSKYTYNGKMLNMESYLQELLDLIEWANGNPKTSKLAAMRAKAGHPKPFNLKYLGIGNEDLIGEVFTERFNYLNEGVKKVYPEITVVGTVGPFYEGSDYEYGWKLAREKNLDIVDEHYYNPVGWYIHNQDFYDKYRREGTKVYLGEWASKGNLLENALAEALYICGLERNGDVVTMSSYAPLLAREGHTQWNPDMIYFNNTEVKPTPNYYVQMMAGQNAGDEYVYAQGKLTYSGKIRGNANLRVANSVTIDKETGDLIIKLVNALPKETTVNLNIAGGSWNQATLTTLSGKAEDRIVKEPRTEALNAIPATLTLPAYSYQILRLK